MKKLLDFLEQRATTYLSTRDAGASAGSRSRDSSVSHDEAANSGQNSKRMRPSNFKKPADNGGSTNDPGVSNEAPEYPPCVVCRRDHALYRCAEFIAMNYEQREEVRAKHDLCHVCLKHHRAGECKQPSRPCDRCASQGRPSTCISPAPVAITVPNNDIGDHLQAEALRRFWSWEEAMDNRKADLTAEERQVEKYFLESHYRDREGRYVVFIPLKEGAESRAIALRRFHQLERRLQGNPSLREAYIRAMREEEDAGYIQIADRPPKGMVYYIPHHPVAPVLRKFRIVDDASYKTTNGKSLNDVQMTGPKLQFDLNVIMRFRRQEIAFTADVEKMFKQVRIDPSQWDLMRIFWRESPQHPLKEYWRTTVIFGMASSVYNACRAMIQCARYNAAQFPEAARAIEDSFYMDDGLSGAETIELAQVLCREIVIVRQCHVFHVSACNRIAHETTYLNMNKRVSR